MTEPSNQNLMNSPFVGDADFVGDSEPESGAVEPSPVDLNKNQPTSLGNSPRNLWGWFTTAVGSTVGSTISSAVSSTVGSAVNSTVGYLVSIGAIAPKIAGWFSVDEAQIEHILTTVRANLPTTEVWLIGKTQAGKSSIVRGLTGISAEIVGQGFRPHTQHTERYAYPSSDLPLFIFTDTVGLGESHPNADQTTKAIAQELLMELEQDSQRARVLVWTVKITDFAIATLRDIAQQVRQRYPTLPCLLVVTCLHEAYPSDVTDHPPYPPPYQDVNRAFEALKTAFSPLWDQAMVIDFTLETDEYTPVFYGLDALRDALASLLPEAEARTIHQLLDREAGQQLGGLYRDVARRYILAFTIMAATIAAVPLPFATMPVLTTLQVSMIGVLGQVYGQVLSPSQAGGIMGAIAGGFLAQAIGREAIKFLPGVGSVVAASWAAAYTWALGEGACVYFGDLMGGKKPDPAKIHAVVKESFRTFSQNPLPGTWPKP